MRIKYSHKTRWSIVLCRGWTFEREQNPRYRYIKPREFRNRPDRSHQVKVNRASSRNSASCKTKVRNGETQHVSILIYV
jgi:hypothetical protein